MPSCKENVNAMVTSTLWNSSKHRMYGPVVDLIVFFILTLTGEERGGCRWVGGGGGDSTRGDFEPEHNIFFFNICANAIKLDDFFRNLSGNNVMWPVNVP